MKLSVSAFRAQASAQRKILSSYQSQLNYGTCTSFPALGGYKLEDKSQVMVDTTGINSTKAPNANDKPQTLEDPVAVQDSEMTSKKVNEEEKEETEKSEEIILTSDKIPGRNRSKSNQRWMKLRTTVQLSGAISTTQKSKPQLKREDSFLKRFSTRQIPEAQETIDTGDETETLNGSQTQTEINRRRRKRRKEMSKTVVNPDENFYFYWLMTVTVCVLYNLWTLIVRQSFPELQKAASVFWYSGDGFTDVVFVCDIVMQFRTGYLEQGLMVYDSKKLAYHYLKSRAFIFDLLSLLPLDLLQVNIGVNPILRFPRFFKIYRVYSYYYIVESRTVYPNLWRVVNLIHILLILAHWFGCFYYLLSEAEGFQGDWVYPYRPGDYATLTRKYLGSLYWSTLTLTTIGDLPTPETNAESRGHSKAMTAGGQSEGIPRRGHKSRLLQFNSNYGYVFTIISYLIGVFIFATIVGQVGNVITNRNANRLEFERLLDGAKTYMRHHKVPGGMKRRVLRWYDYSWSRGRIQGGGDINTALGLLPDKLKTELALHVNLSVLKKVTIFQECQPEFLHDLVLKMKAYIFTPGDLICRKGEVAREMFIIADGILDVISETGRVLTTMKAGDFFGEIGILNLDGLNKRTADVRSVGYSELFSLSREDVLTAMKDYPEAQEILQSLGRKRLMEAKNASKMFKVQAKQAKDHDSSGDSDSAGKRIVEKLRSDVKGLKNALRRSRRETRNKETGQKTVENSGGNRHSILRRMSHVQSSDEYETNNDVEQSPIGAGLPLLQRLKLLKEKQEKDREEKEKSKLITPNESQRKKDDNVKSEVTGIGLPFTQKLKLLKQKEGKEPTALGSVVVSSTVRTQLTGMRFDKSIFKCKNIGFVKEGDEKNHETMVGEENCDSNLRKKESTESQRIWLKQKLKVVQSSQEKEKILPSNVLQEAEIVPNFTLTPETQLETKKYDYSVPKLVRNKFEVSKTKDAWKLLKYSSLTCSKPDLQNKKEINKVVMKVRNRGTYLSKSDTVLEKQKSWEREEEKRSRSVSPSDILNSHRTNLQKENYSARERRRAKSVSPSSKIVGVGEENEENGGSATDFGTANPSSSARKDFNDKSPGEKRRRMKKYISISDLSPEYSGLPFVKKLKILNERQKLEELEKELLVRSVSLDVPERPVTKRERALVRSQSDAYTTEVKSAPNLRAGAETKWQNEKSLAIYCFEPKSDHFKSRNPENNDGSRHFLEECLDSPESNETLERKHLKSILKKLSAEGSTSDEDQISNTSKVISTLKKADNTEFKKLIRAPTLEGYAARHKKLTKSVTFDSEPLLSPPEVVLEQTSEEGKGKSTFNHGLSPMSPTAILTLQLSNLSMIPIAGPKTTDTKGDEERIIENNKLDKESIELKTPMVKVTGTRMNYQAEAKHFETSEKENDQDKFLMPYVLQELLEKSFRVLSFNKNSDDDSFAKIKVGISRVLEEFLEEVNFKFKTQFSNLRTEVEKRDEIILQLYSRIQDLERNASFDDIRTLCSPSAEPERYSNGKKISETVDEDPLKEHFNYVDNAVKYEERNPLEEKICYLQSSDNARLLARDFESPLEVNSVEDFELAEVPASFGSKDFRRKRMKFHLIKNFSLDDESESEEIAKSENSASEIIKSEDEEELIESRSKGSFINRMTKIQRSFSRSQGKTSDFVALDIDDSSNSSDTENLHNKDWEVQMLVEELEKEDSEWKAEEEKYNSRKDLEHLDDVRNLQEEVDRLKEMVCQGDLTRLTGSELDILESIIEAKDQKISELEKSSSLDGNDISKSQRKQPCNCALGSDRLKKYGGRRKKPSLRQKIGQALSFDFHDIDSQKSHDRIKHRAVALRKQKTFSCSPQEHQNVYNLWHTSSRLKNKVLEDSGQTIRNLSFRSSTEKRAGSSLPILIPGCLPREKLNEVRTSLPIIAAKELRTNFSQILRSSERLSPSIGSYKDMCKKSYFKQNHESTSDESKVWRKSIQREIRNSSPTLTSELIRSNDCQGSSTLNNFIKSVGQKVKQVMACEGNIVRNQVPTISQLCDERVKHIKLEVSENLEVSGHGEESGVKSIDNDQSKFSDSLKMKSKTEPPDL